MADENTASRSGNGKVQLLPLAAGLLIAGLCFALLFAAMAYLIPVLFRFDMSPRSRVLAPLAILFISVGGLIRYVRGRAERVRARTRHRCPDG